MSLSRTWTGFLFSFSIFVLAAGLYVVFDQFLGVTGEEIVKAWYFGQMVDLQEGQILPSIAKNQSVLQNSPFIKAVLLVDVKDPVRPLFSIGDLSHPISAAKLAAAIKAPKELTRYRSGFLANVIMARIPGNYNLVIVYEVSSGLLIWSYYLAVAVGILFVGYLMGLTMRLSNVERRKREALRTDLLARLAHDLDSPLLSISSLSLKVKKLDQDLHRRLEQATQSIRNLLTETDRADKKLLREAATPTSAIDEEFNEVPVAAVLREFVATKRGELSSISDLNLELHVAPDCLDAFVRINLSDFRRHLTNVFKNSVEALDGRDHRSIKLDVSRSGSEIRITIEDTGRGIPAEQLHLIGKKGLSLGKKGKGLGLYFLLESIRHWQGQFNIQSQHGVGTTISITLPKATTPKWYLSGLPEEPTKKTVFIDDDTSMIDRWKTNLRLRDGEFLEFNASDQFRKWFHAGGQFEDGLRFVFDYHLDGDNTGLALIDELGIARESTLVTSGYLDESILRQAAQLDVKVMPKVMV